MQEDKKTIGVTSENRSILDRLVEKGGFKDQIDAAKCAVALAINRGVQPGQTEGAGTIWNVGSFDSTGELRALIPNLFPGIDAPYRAVESLLNEGLRIIATDYLSREPFSLSDLLEQRIEA